MKDEYGGVFRFATMSYYLEPRTELTEFIVEWGTDYDEFIANGRKTEGSRTVEVRTDPDSDSTQTFKVEDILGVYPFGSQIDRETNVLNVESARPYIWA